MRVRMRVQCEVHAGDPENEGIVWPGIAEISLLGAIGCGERMHLSRNTQLTAPLSGHTRSRLLCLPRALRAEGSAQLAFVYGLKAAKLVTDATRPLYG
eukprot:648262-Pleurochrysis_carterae.AAC.1